MTDESVTPFGVGLYTVKEAQRITGVPGHRIRRWITGYDYSYQGSKHRSPMIWQPQLFAVDGRVTLGFHDLLEVRFVNAFVEQGVSLHKIRKATTVAAELLQQSHPFSTKRFKTDGQTLFLEMIEVTGEKWLLNLFSKQYQFQDVVWQCLYTGLDFSELDQATRWWPLSPKKRVVIDPRRAFGQPILNKNRIPTSVLAAAFAVEKSVSKVARWYDLPRKAVEDAVEFEQKLAA